MSHWTGLIWPTERVRITLPFRAEDTPWYSAQNPHRGIDIAPFPGSQGRPVRAPLSGKVTHVGNHKAAGLEVVIAGVLPFAWRARNVKGAWVDFEAGEVAHIRMTHHSEVLVNVGAVVQAGELVARIGSTGTNSSGPHVHFEVRKGRYEDGLVVDPVDLFRTAAPGLLDTPGQPVRLGQFEPLVLHGLDAEDLGALATAASTSTPLVLRKAMVASRTGPKIDLRLL